MPKSILYISILCTIGLLCLGIGYGVLLIASTIENQAGRSIFVFFLLPVVLVGSAKTIALMYGWMGRTKNADEI